MKRSSLKSIILVFAMCFFAGNIFAQGAYVNLNLGYGFGMGSQSTSFSTTNWTNLTDHTIYNESIDLSFGKGLNIGGTFGYMFNKNVGAELGLSYLIGGKTELTDLSTQTNTSTTEIYTISASMIRINPTFVVTAGFDKINPYAKFGVIIGIGSVISDCENTTKNNALNTSTIIAYTTKFNGGIALGLNSAVGVTFAISEKLSIFGELNMVNMSWAPTKGETNKFTVDGADKLSLLTTHDKITDFVDSYTYNSAATTSDASNDISLKLRMPFGSFGVNFGAKFSF